MRPGFHNTFYRAPFAGIRMRSLAALGTLMLLLAGCTQGTNAPGPTEATERGVEAPWWPVGAWWDIELKRGTEAVQRFRLVNFWNDSASSHFWLGVQDRDGCATKCGFGGSALDHALHDNNPLLGRIHWGLLTPHEKGVHANGMYAFPAKPGDTREGAIAFGRTWDLLIKPGPREGTLLFEGTADDGAKMSYDYDPAKMWFTFLEIKDGAGKTELRIDVKGHGLNQKGTYWFLRGRDYTDPPLRNVGTNGSREETFTAKQEEIPLKSLALEINGQATGPMQIQIKDPAGTVRHEETLVTSPAHTVKELANPTIGQWKIVLTGSGTFYGTIEVVGILEYNKTL